MHAALPPPRQQAGFLEHPQVPRDGGEGDVEGLREVADGRFGLRQPREDRPAGRVGQRGERPIEGRGIVNH